MGRGPGVHQTQVGRAKLSEGQNSLVFERESAELRSDKYF